MADMVILQEIDKCMKCRGCQVACQNAQGLTRVPAYDGVPTVSWDDPMVVKPQNAVNDEPPYVRYSCWHCDNPPCVPACKLGAMKIDTNTGAVYVDDSLCDPTDPLCGSACVRLCRRGGYPKIRPEGSGDLALAFKCNLCYDKEGGPRCVQTCPAGSLSYGTRAAMLTKQSPYSYKAGDGRVLWASSKAFITPTTDPFIEDHISPMAGNLVAAKAGKLLTVPTLAIGGLYALYRRRMELKCGSE